MRDKSRPAEAGYLFAGRSNGPQDSQDPTTLQAVLQSSLHFQELEDERMDLWARTAHDLRAPLTAASGYCALILEDQVGPLTEEQKELLGRVQHNLRKLSRMATAMFHLAMERQPDHKPEFRRGNIENCIRSACNELRYLIDEKNLVLTTHVQRPDIPLYFEPTLIEQALVNLLESACRATPRHGRISLRAYPASWHFPRSLEEDSDTGSQQATPAYRVTLQDSRPVRKQDAGRVPDAAADYGEGSYDSDGLGLTITRSIIRCHNGEIWVESSNEGTTASFALPVHEATPGGVAQKSAPVLVKG